MLNIGYFCVAFSDILEIGVNCSQFWCISLFCFNRMVWLSWLNDCYWPRITHFPAFVFANKAKTKVINNPVQIQPKCIRERIAQNISHDWRSNNWAFDISLLVHKAMPRNHSEKTYFSFLLNYKFLNYRVMLNTITLKKNSKTNFENFFL